MNTNPIFWSDLTLPEKSILEHLAGIYTDKAQTLILSPDQPVKVVRTTTSLHDRSNILNVPAPSTEEIDRIRTFCSANVDMVTILKDADNELHLLGSDL